MENISERAVASVGNESPGDPPKGGPSFDRRIHSIRFIMQCAHNA